MATGVRAAAGSIVVSPRAWHREPQRVQRARRLYDRSALRLPMPSARRVYVGYSLQADTRIQVRVEQIDDQVDADEGRGKQEDRGLDDRIVPVVDRLDRVTADARPREDRLRDHGSAEERAELDADDRHDGDRRVLQRVFPDDGA